MTGCVIVVLSKFLLNRTLCDFCENYFAWHFRSVDMVICGASASAHLGPSLFASIESDHNFIAKSNIEMSRTITRSVATGLVLAGAASVLNWHAIITLTEIFVPTLQPIIHRHDGYSILANSITAGGIFCFPLYAPILAKDLSLTQPQLSTIALAWVLMFQHSDIPAHKLVSSRITYWWRGYRGMSAQYPLAAVMGSLLDTYGTWLTAGIGAILFSTGWGWFSYEVKHAKSALIGVPGQLISLASPGASQSIFRRLVVCYFMCGVGTAASWVRPSGLCDRMADWRRFVCSIKNFLGFSPSCFLLLRHFLVTPVSMIDNPRLYDLGHWLVDIYQGSARGLLRHSLGYHPYSSLSWPPTSLPQMKVFWM
jgi:hypothetical protein